MNTKPQLIRMSPNIVTYINRTIPDEPKYTHVDENRKPIYISYVCIAYNLFVFFFSTITSIWYLLYRLNNNESKNIGDTSSRSVPTRLSQM